MRPVAARGFVLNRLLQAESIAVVGEDSELRNELVAQLQHAGVKGVYASDGLAVEDKPVGLIVLESALAENAQQGIEHQLRIFSLLKQHLADDRAGFFVLVQRQEADQKSLHLPWSQGGVALLRTAAIEYPALVFKHMAVAGGDAELPQRVLAELLNGGNDEVVLSADGQRYVWQDRLAEAHVGAGSLQDNDVIVVSGGGRGVTAECILSLATHLPLRFVLLGRSQLCEETADSRAAGSEAELIQLLLSQSETKTPQLKALKTWANQILASREIHSVISRLKTLGSEAQYVPIDVQDPGAVAATLSQIRQRWGEISGIVHGAGVLADKSIADKSAEQFRRVLETKLLGLQSLLQATPDDPLKLLVMFSSVAARFGNRGQCDYASANETLNQIALYEARQRPHCVVKSMMWGPWDGGMVTPALKQHFEQAGVSVIPLDDGAHWFADEIMDDSGEVLIVLGEGKPLSKNSDPQPAQWAVSVTASNYQYLNDHRVDDVVVLPVVQVVEWLGQAGLAMGRQRSELEIEGLQVSAGITLKDFADSAETFFLQLSPEGNHGNYAARLTDREGKLRYQALLKYTPEPRLPPAENVPAIPASQWPIDIGDAYSSDSLFHGPQFQAIAALGEYGERHASVELYGHLDQAWSGPLKQMLPGLMDGCLQALVLLGHARRAQASLPMSIQSIRWGRPPSERNLALLEVRESSLGLEADIKVLNHAGERVLSLAAVAMFYRTPKD